MTSHIYTRVIYLHTNTTTNLSYIGQTVQADDKRWKAHLTKSRNGSNSKFPVCYWNAGYSAGWCSESFGLNLEAREIHCRAKGDKVCRFVMAPSEKIEQRILETYKEGF